MFSIRNGGVPGLNTPIEVVQGPSNSLFLVNIACNSLDMLSEQTVLFALDPAEDVEKLEKNDEAAAIAFAIDDLQHCCFNTSDKSNASATAPDAQLACQSRLPLESDSPSRQNNTSRTGTQLEAAFMRSQAIYKQINGAAWEMGVKK